MKKAILLISLSFITLNIMAQRIVEAYYYLEHPSSDLFSESYGGKPDGKSDPKPMPSDAGISDDDLNVKKSSLKQTMDNSKSIITHSCIILGLRIKTLKLQGSSSKLKE